MIAFAGRAPAYDGIGEVADTPVTDDAAVSMADERQLVGRDAEVTLVRGFVSDLTDGRGGVIWVEGEPGVGKSALIDAALCGDDDAAVAVFKATGDELSQVFGLRAMAACLGVNAAMADEHRRQIADLLSGVGGGVDAVSAASERLLGLVDRECARSPVILVLDDLQWADSASLAVWHRLTRVVDQIPLLLVSARRPVPQRAEVEGLRRAVARVSRGAIIELSALDAGEVGTMATCLLAARPGARLREVLAQATGNPLYVRELTDVLVRQGLIRIENNLAELAAPIGEGLSSVGAAIGRRLSFLTEPTRTVLRAGAVLGARFTANDLAVVSGRTVPGLLEVVDEAIAAGVLAEAGQELTFRHPLIRQALYDEIPKAVRTGLHGHMAQSLAAAGASWERVARQLLAVSGAIEGWVLAWLAEVEESVMYTQSPIAAELLERALRATAWGNPLWTVLTARLTTALRLLRRWDDLAERGRMALRWASDPQLVGQIATNTLTALFTAGRFDEGLALADKVLASTDPGQPWGSRLRAARAMLLLYRGETVQSRVLAFQAASEGERYGDPMTIGMAMHSLALAAPPPDALEFIDRGIAAIVSDDPQSLDVRLMLMTNQLVYLSNLHRLAEFDEILPNTVSVAENAGSHRVRGIHLVAAMHYYERGDWDQALLYHEMAAGAPDPSAYLPWHGLGSQVALRRGDQATAEAHLAAVGDFPYTTGRFRPSGGLLIATRALMAESDGHLDAAVAMLAAWLDPQYAQGTNFDRTTWLPELTRLALAAGDHKTADAAVVAANEDADLAADDLLLLTARICQAMVAEDPEPLLTAADYFERVPRRLDLAFVCAEASVVLAKQGDMAGARDALNRAATIHHLVGARLDLQRLQARLRPLGIRRGPRSVHRRADTGWDALTPAERLVAERVMRGESNPEIAASLFLSRRTVETHVSHILGKLKVSGRADIAREAARHLPSGPDGTA